MSIIINGSLSKPFRMERGLWQEDPLSPFLFVLVAEVLNRLLGKAVSMGLTEGIELGSSRVTLSHLQFVDDTILFAPMKQEILFYIRRILNCFGLMSGLKTNYEKSTIIPVNCDDFVLTDLRRNLQCQVLSLPVKYLGIPLGANPRREDTCDPIIDKIKKRLNGWKSKLLSKASRLT